MDLEKNKLTCQFCNLKFSSISTKNRHKRTKHADQDTVSTSEGPKRTQHIMCPICTSQTSFSFHTDLIEHLSTFHNLTINESNLYFRNFEEFSAWRTQENREVDYACRTGRKYPHGEEKKVYECNRSDYKGFVSSAQKRSMKRGGSIHIHGTCPSRIIVNILAEGSVTVKFVETHVGHIDELRTKRLSKAEQETIVQKLAAGVSNQKIIEDSRIIQNDQLERKNLVTKEDLAYLIRKFKIDNRSGSVLGTSSFDDKESNVLYIDEPSTRQVHYHDDVDHFIQTRPRIETIAFEEKREIILQEMNSFARSLDEESFSKYVDFFRNFKADTEQQNAEGNSKKRKIEKQTYYPNKK